MKAAPHVLGEKKKKERGGLCPDASRCGKMFVASRKVWLVRDRCEEHLSAVDLGQTYMNSDTGRYTEVAHMCCLDQVPPQEF